MGNQIRAQLGFFRIANPDLALRGQALVDGLTNNSNFLDLPNLDALRNAVNALDAANVAAQDGGKMAKAAQASARENLIEEYKLTAAYVIKTAAGDMEKITSANLPVITPKAVVEPAGSLPPPVPRKLVRGPNPGELSLYTRAVPGAHGYQGRYAATWPTPGPWTEFPIPKVKSATTIRGLLPGTRYAIQVRALGDKDYSDWSDSITIMCA